MDARDWRDVEMIAEEGKFIRQGSDGRVEQPEQLMARAILRLKELIEQAEEREAKREGVL